MAKCYMHGELVCKPMNPKYNDRESNGSHKNLNCWKWVGLLSGCCAGVVIGQQQQKFPDAVSYISLGYGIQIEKSRIEYAIFLFWQVENCKAFA